MIKANHKKIVKLITFLLLLNIYNLFAQSSVVTINSSGNLIVNGDPFFMNAIYNNVECYDYTTTSHLQTIKDAGINTVMTYNQLNVQAYNGPWDSSYLDRAHAVGLKVIIDLSRYTRNGSFNNINLIVRQFKDHPALLGWYAFDEIWDLTKTETVYSNIKAIDNNHPIWGVICCFESEPYNIFSNSADIMGFDLYSVGGGDQETNQKKNYEYSKLMNNYYTPPNKTVMSVSQIFNQKSYSDTNVAAREQTLQEKRLAAYILLAGGNKGNFFYSYFDILARSQNCVLWPDNVVNNNTAEMKIYGQEIADVGRMAVLNGTEFDQQAEGNTYFLKTIGYKKNSMEAYVLAANISMSLSRTIIVEIPLTNWTQADVSVLYGNITATKVGSKLYITTPPGESGTVRIKKPVDTQAPSIPTGLTHSLLTKTSFKLSWLPSTDGIGSGVRGYDVYKNGAYYGWVNAPETSMNITGLNCATSNSWTVDAADEFPANNISAPSQELTVMTGNCFDSQPPSAPINLTSSSITKTSFTLSWSASVDNEGGGGVRGYDVYKNRAYYGWVDAPARSINISGQTCGTTNSWTVDATDSLPENNISIHSQAIIITTSDCVDTQAPSVPTNLISSLITKTSFKLSWSASVDNIGGGGVRGYDVYKNGTYYGWVDAPATSINITGQACGKANSWRLDAADSLPENNVSAPSQAITVVTLDCVDTKAPTAPTNLISSLVTKTSFKLSWSASVDNEGGGGVRGYDVYKNGAYYGWTDAPATHIYIFGLTCGTSDNWSVDAADALPENNIGGTSIPLLVTTADCNDTSNQNTAVSGESGTIKIRKATLGIERVVNNFNNSILSIYPNPNNGTFNVGFDNLQTDNYILEVINTLGINIYSENLTNYSGNMSKQLNLSSKQKGVYIITLKNSSGSKISKKLIIN